MKLREEKVDIRVKINFSITFWIKILTPYFLWRFCDESNGCANGRADCKRHV